MNLAGSTGGKSPVVRPIAPRLCRCAVRRSKEQARRGAHVVSPQSRADGLGAERHTRRVWRRGDLRLAARAHRARLGRPTQEDTMADDITKRIARFIEPFQVTPGSHVKL